VYTGNQDIAHETAYQFELGFDWHNEKAYIAPRVFYHYVDDYIQGVPIAESNVSAEILEAVTHINDKALRFDNIEAVPIRNLSDILQLNLATSETKNFCFAVILQHGINKMALLVDEVENECEIILMPLNKPLQYIPNVTGATSDNRGNIIMVLNPDNLISLGLGGQHTQLNLGHDYKENETLQRILIVDDSLTTRTMEKNILESQGFDVTSAINGVEALELLNKDANFDLIISDIEMPKMNGFELTQKVKDNPNLQQIPVVIVSSLDSDEYRQQGLDAGADAQIVKGKFESRILLDAIDRLI